jgi:predicted MPP superfamily phosphohydrolase
LVGALLSTAELVAVNLLLLAFDLWLLRRLHQRRDPKLLITGLLAGFSLCGTVAMLLMLAGWSTVFGVMQLLCWALFLHGPVVILAAAAWIPKLRWMAILPLLSTALAIEAFVREPTALGVETLQIPVQGLEEPYTILLIADLQTDSVGDYERQALAQVRALEPDLLLWAGDYIQVYEPQGYQVQLQALRAEILGLSTPGLAVGGDIDGLGRWQDLFEGTQTRALTQSQTLDVGPIAVTGLTLADSRSATPPIPSLDKPHVVFGHAPDFALARPDAELLLAGHTHGGQVQLPGIGPLMTLSEVPREWASGVTQLSDASTLVVSRGVGLERADAPRLRLFCEPQLVLIHLVPSP